MLHPFRSLTLAALLSAAATVLLAGQAPPPSGPLAPALQPFVDDHAIAGAVALVADKDKVLDLEAVGYSNLAGKKPMQTNDLFWIASMTKSFTASALMMLVQEGKVNINDPVEKYLPEFKGQKVAEDADLEHPRLPHHPITVREVMSHTSGLIQGSERGAKPSYSLKNDVAQYAATPLKREPGTKYEYNNSGINTGGRIIEVVSGMPYAQFLQMRLLDPLGMKHTTFWPTEEQGKRLANSFRLTADKTALEDVKLDKNLSQALIDKLGKGVPVPARLLHNFGMGVLRDYSEHYAMPAGGLYSTADDLAKFCQMLLNGGTFRGKRYLTEEVLKEMTSNQTGDVPVNPDEGYGQGWSVKKTASEGPSIGSFGHRGARKTMMWIDPKNQLVMILLLQAWELPGDKQKQLYTSFMKAAIAKYGKAP